MLLTKPQHVTAKAAPDSNTAPSCPPELLAVCTVASKTIDARAKCLGLG